MKVIFTLMIDFKILGDFHYETDVPHWCSGISRHVLRARVLPPSLRTHAAKRLLATILASLVGAWGAGGALAQETAPQNRSSSIAISAQALDSALNELARQSDL